VSGHLGAVAQENDRLVQGDEHRIDPAVVVEVARREPSPEVGRSKGFAGKGVDVGEGCPRPAKQELERHGVRVARHDGSVLHRFLQVDQG
jgi:hypothetical protein